MPVRVAGVQAHVRHVKQLGSAEMIEEVTAALYAAGSLIEIDAEQSITRGSISGAGHIPSAPGEPPKRDTGVLDSNIETARVAPLKVEVSSNAPYAVPLEIGTSKMAARPYMAPAAQRGRQKAQDLVTNAVERVMKKGKAAG